MIPQIQPYFDRSEWKEVKKVLRSTYLTENKATETLEEMFCTYTGAKYAIAVNNATVGLYCCLKALGIGDNPDDEVIVPNLTFIATANAVLMAGAKVVLHDVNSYTCQLSVDGLEEKINKNTKAIIPVHLYGYAAEIDTINDICERNYIFCIEDAAQALGVLYKDRHVGTLGTFGVISLYGNKSITTGEGGIILTNSEELYKKCYRLKNHGREKKGVFIHEEIGYNFCFTDLQAAIGIAQMNKYDKILKRKEEIFLNYCKGFEGIEEIEYFDEKNTTPNYWFSSFKFSKSTSLKFYLEKNGIQTRDFFYPLSLQPCYKNREDVIIDGDSLNSCKLYSQSLSLPSSFNLTNRQQKYIIRRIKEFYDT